MRKPIIGFILSALLLTSCGGGEDITNILGAYTATGTIAQTGASLYRRGTHQLLMSGRPRFFLESKTVDLNAYSGKRVAVRGEVSPNTHKKFLPIFRVDEVNVVGDIKEVDVQEYTVSSLHLSLEAPRSWVSDLSDGRLTFSLPEESGPFVAVELRVVDLFPEGLHVRIDGQNGVRIVDEETGVHTVFVDTGADDATLFIFAPKGEESLLLRDAFYTMLRSVDFDEIKNGDNSEDPEDISGSGIPCGGPAGVLCPEGEYCKVREIDTGIGVCRQLR
jgi:hypothetical protein